jgi:hypothetical protein
LNRLEPRATMLAPSAEPLKLRTFPLFSLAGISLETQIVGANGQLRQGPGAQKRKADVLESFQACTVPKAQLCTWVLSPAERHCIESPGGRHPEGAVQKKSPGRRALSEEELGRNGSFRPCPVPGVQFCTVVVRIAERHCIESPRGRHPSDGVVQSKSPGGRPPAGAVQFDTVQVQGSVRSMATVQAISEDIARYGMIMHTDTAQILGTAQTHDAVMSDTELQRVTDEIVRMHRMPRMRKEQQKTHKEREKIARDREVSVLMELLPLEVVKSMLGGDRGMQQIPEGSQRRDYLRRVIEARAGSEGARIADLRKLLCTARIYAATVMNLPKDKWDSALFPMSAALAHILVHSKHITALKKAADKQGNALVTVPGRSGGSVGPQCRDTIIFAATKMLWPIESIKTVLDGAAPKPADKGSNKAGTPPLALKCAFEEWANDLNTIPGTLGEEARKAVSYYCKTFLAGGIDQGIRVGEGVKVILQVDEISPDTVMRGIAYMAKDGAPLNLYAPAEGFLGPYTWYREYLRTALETGQIYPKWNKPRGSKGTILKTSGLEFNYVAEKEEIREAFKDISMLLYSKQEMDEMVLRGHSMHVAYAEWCRTIWSDPCLKSGLILPKELAKGFSDSDCGVCGHWLRDATPMVRVAWSGRKQKVIIHTFPD